MKKHTRPNPPRKITKKMIRASRALNTGGGKQPIPRGYSRFIFNEFIKRTKATSKI